METAGSGLYSDTPVNSFAPMQPSAPQGTQSDHLSTALETVMANFAGMVKRVGWRHRLSDADIDEVMQEVRIRLWRARASSEQISTSSASYVYRTAVSAALDIARRRRARRAEVTDPIDDVMVAAPGGPMAEAEGTELADQVAKAVETIAPARRPVVRMYLAGYPREEIAELLGWSEAKTRNLLYRGLADLRARLTEQGIRWTTE
jgi:RNA polymerase sigma-70 factor (ECF subfamily)